jgi:ElaB/YqjD/DUF883 family membrane-anchored ribosome-binding protein
MYNPIFELEDNKGRDKELKSLRDMICYRAGRDQMVDFAKKFSTFVKRHPMTTLSMAAILGLGLGSKK